MVTFFNCLVTSEIKYNIFTNIIERELKHKGDESNTQFFGKKSRTSHLQRNFSYTSFLSPEIRVIYSILFCLWTGDLYSSGFSTCSCDLLKWKYSTSFA